MNSKRFFFVLIVVLVLINAAGVAAIVYGSKILDKQNTKLTELKVEASTLEDVQRSLITAKKDIENYKDIEQISKTVVPQEKDQARTVREIVKLAEESNIKIASITFPTSSLGTKSTGTSAPSSQSAGSKTQTQKVEGIDNVERLEITVSSDSSQPILYSNFLSFMHKLEQNRRTSQVSNINIQPVSGNRNFLTFSLVLNVYIKK